MQLILARLTAAEKISPSDSLVPAILVARGLERVDRHRAGAGVFPAGEEIEDRFCGEPRNGGTPGVLEPKHYAMRGEKPLKARSFCGEEAGPGWVVRHDLHDPGGKTKGRHLNDSRHWSEA
jgi:hypothetical protein